MPSSSASGGEWHWRATMRPLDRTIKAEESPQGQTTDLRSSLEPRAPGDDRVQRLSQREIPRVPRERCPHLACDIGVANARLRIGEPQRTARARRSERALAAKRPHGTVLHEAQRELHA